MEFAEKVDTVFWYGAVDIDPKHLVVWVILSGAADGLPKWYFPTEEGGIDVRWNTLAPMLSTIVVTIRAGFEAENWPCATRIRVGFDATERVEAGGGYEYFK